ncbi:MAG: MarR family transcriptional regulator, partial [Solirubrobacteraceae bacterium]
PPDRRSAWISATATGHRAAQRIRHARTVALGSAIDQLDEADRQLIEHALPALERLGAVLAEGQR